MMPISPKNISTMLCAGYFVGPRAADSRVENPSWPVKDQNVIYRSVICFLESNVCCKNNDTLPC